LVCTSSTKFNLTVCIYRCNTPPLERSDYLIVTVQKGATFELFVFRRRAGRFITWRFMQEFDWPAIMRG
jgi:hypothetical protein